MRVSVVCKGGTTDNESFFGSASGIHGPYSEWVCYVAKQGFSDFVISRPSKIIHKFMGPTISSGQRKL
jgi:hypothetical protein